MNNRDIKKNIKDNKKTDKINYKNKKYKNYKNNKKPVIIGTITENPKQSAALAKAEAADMVEIRFDKLISNESGYGLKEKSEIISIVNDVRESGLPIIGTIRSKSEGGKFSDNLKEFVGAVSFVIPYVDLIDIEISIGKKNIRKLKRIAVKNETDLIISSHPRRAPAPKILKKQIKKAIKFEPFLIKIAPSFKSYSEGIYYFNSIEKITEKMDSEKQLYSLIPVGKNVSILRKEMINFGSFYYYGSITKSVAPGQLSIKELLE